MPVPPLALLRYNAPMTFDFTADDRQALMLALSDSIQCQRMALTQIDADPDFKMRASNVARERSEHLKKLLSLRARLMRPPRPSRPLKINISSEN